MSGSRMGTVCTTARWIQRRRPMGSTDDRIFITARRLRVVPHHTCQGLNAVPLGRGFRTTPMVHQLE